MSQFALPRRGDPTCARNGARGSAGEHAGQLRRARREACADVGGVAPWTVDISPRNAIPPAGLGFDQTWKGAVKWRDSMKIGRSTVEVSRHCENSLGLSPRGRRGRVSKWSDKASRRLSKAIAESVAGWAAGGARGVTMITLTYRSEVVEYVTRRGAKRTRRVRPLTAPQMDASKAHLRAFLQQLRRLGVEKYVGWLEFQRNGTPHYHLLVPGVVFGSSLRPAWLRISGQEIDGVGEVALSVTHKVGSADYLIRCGATYAQKEGSKSAQKVPPASCRWTGRWWYASRGICDDHALFDLDPKSGRYVRRWLKARNKLQISRCFVGPEMQVSHASLYRLLADLEKMGGDVKLRDGPNFPLCVRRDPAELRPWWAPARELRGWATNGGL